MAVADPEIFLARLKIAIGRDDFYAWGRSVGLSDGVWQTLKRGSLPKIDTLVKISETTGRSIDWLLGRDAVITTPAPDIGLIKRALEATSVIQSIARTGRVPTAENTVENNKDTSGFEFDEGTETRYEMNPDWYPADIDALHEYLETQARDLEIAVANADAAIENATLSNEFVYIPRYDVTVSGGTGHWHDNGESAKFMMAFRRHWVEKYLLAKPKDLSVVRVHGDSMSPVLQPGDNILINHSLTTVDDGIFVLRIDGRVIVKRTQYLSSNTLRVISENPAYPPYEVDLNNEHNQTDFEIIGRVVWYGRQI